MKSIPTDAKRIKITFICDLCGVEVEYETDIPATEITAEAVCNICYKRFPFKITPTGVEITDIADDDITIESI